MSKFLTKAVVGLQPLACDRGFVFTLVQASIPRSVVSRDLGTSSPDSKAILCGNNVYTVAHGQSSFDQRLWRRS